jgi:hypothetical protein
MRFLADIPEADVQWLDAVAKEQGKSRAAVLREAVSSYRAEKPSDWIERGFGLWKDRTDLMDAVTMQQRMRAESTRPWDVDYEEVKRKFPDLFRAEDDLERAHYLALVAAKKNAVQEQRAKTSPAKKGKAQRVRR